MSTTRLRVLIIAVFVGIGMAIAMPAMAACNPKPGTVITMSNWQQYKDCFSEGVQTFWQGTGFWKMPQDVEMHVGPAHHWTFPQPFIADQEKYGGQTRLVKLPDGRYKLENYVVGFPFPNPSGPEKGTEIAANVTYRFQSFIYAGFPDNGSAAPFYTKDRFGNWNTETVDYVYRQLAYNWDPAVPRVEPNAAGAWYTEWLMVETPEQSKYTADLTIFWQDNLKEEANYVFIPALRRSLRLSTTARCAPLLGSDMTHDDQRVGWNGGVGMFQGKFLRTQNLLEMDDMNLKVMGKFPQSYDGMLGWMKPSWGDWEVRPVWVIDVRRIPSLRPGYCYGKRIMYIDKQYYQTMAEDLYDSNMKLWKVQLVGVAPGTLDNKWTEFGQGGIIEIYWDVQNDHVSYVTSVGPQGIPFVSGTMVKPQYNNIAKYSTPGGLMQLMR
jgi:hypothetical protein